MAEQLSLREPLQAKLPDEAHIPIADGPTGLPHPEWRGNEGEPWLDSKILSRGDPRTNQLAGWIVLGLAAGMFGTTTLVAAGAGLYERFGPHMAYNKKANSLEVGLIKVAPLVEDCGAPSEWGVNGSLNTELVLGGKGIPETGVGVKFTRPDSAKLSVAQALGSAAAPATPGQKAVEPPENKFGGIYDLTTCFKKEDTTKWFGKNTPNAAGQYPVDPKTGKQIVYLDLSQLSAIGGYDYNQTTVVQIQGGHGATQLANGILDTGGGLAQLGCAGVLSPFHKGNVCNSIDPAAWITAQVGNLEREEQASGAQYIERVCAPQHFTQILQAIDVAYNNTYNGKVEVQYFTEQKDGSAKVVDQDRTHLNYVPDYSKNQIDLLRQQGAIKASPPKGYKLKDMYNKMTCGAVNPLESDDGSTGAPSSTAVPTPGSASSVTGVPTLPAAKPTGSN